MTNEELIEKFQCTGCVAGPNPKSCESYKPSKNPAFVQCEGHVLGTIIAGIGNFALGLPKGFCRPGWDFTNDRPASKMAIRLWPTPPPATMWDYLNVPVWALVKDGFLFVRTYSPRTNTPFVDVIEGGTLDLVPNALNVETFYDDID